MIRAMRPVRLNLANPAFIYTAAWLLALGLAALQITTNLEPIKASTAFLIFSNIASFWLLSFLLTGITRPGGSTTPLEISPVVMERLMRLVKKLLVIWLIGVSITIFYQEGLPLLWAFDEYSLSYADFGIPTFHGLLNSIYMFSMTSLFLNYLVCRNRKSLYLALLLLTWVVLAFARSVLLGVICQSVGIYLLLNGISLKAFVKLLIVAVLVVILFGVIGDYRGTLHQMDTMINEPYYDTLKSYPSGFLWFYVYLTSPLSNLDANIDVVQPNYTPYYSIANLLPSVIREIVYPSDFIRPDDFTLVVEGLNVSTWYAGYISDFGVGISIGIIAIIQIVVLIFYLYAKRNSVWAIIGYSVFFQCLVFSVFYNLLSSQVYIFQLVIALYFGWSVRHVERGAPIIASGPDAGLPPIQTHFQPKR